MTTPGQFKKAGSTTCSAWGSTGRGSASASLGPSMAKRGDRALDLCCGSGDLAFLLSQKVGLDGEVMGVDFSGQQLQTAASRQDQRWKACYKNIKWIEGDALDLPFTDRYFDAVTVGYGLRNVVDKPKAMREILSS
ncbi:Menaquinone biosynthesis methyltransferase ubiE [Hordeum vulgare]|nr:Menaquinone biosynthesis methyltransferase ubiE [Hordeum vulgare]